MKEKAQIPTQAPFPGPFLGKIDVDGMKHKSYLLQMSRTFYFYETAAGNRPVEKFMNSQTEEVREDLLTVMSYIETHKTIPPALFKKLKSTKDLWEVRVRVSGNIFRILCFFDGTKLIVATSGFQKKKQKTPPQEIRTAEKRKKEYFKNK